MRAAAAAPGWWSTAAGAGKRVKLICLGPERGGRTEKAGRRRSPLSPMSAAGCSARLMQYDSGYQYLRTSLAHLKNTVLLHLCIPSLVRCTSERSPAWYRRARHGTHVHVQSCNGT